jgi:hypothetical protein
LLSRGRASLSCLTIIAPEVLPHSQAVHTWVLNPKAIKMGELFGEYNLLTSEWADGLASSLIRAAVGDERPDRHWVVFDGPVDAVWVENMNTGEWDVDKPYWRPVGSLSGCLLCMFSCYSALL